MFCLRSDLPGAEACCGLVEKVGVVDESRGGGLTQGERERGREEGRERKREGTRERGKERGREEGKEGGSE